MAGHRRLAISRLRVPNLDSFVATAGGNLFSIGAPCHWRDTVIVRSQCTNQQKPGGKTWGKNLHARVPGQGRLAICKLRVPNLDGTVTTGAGNLLSIGAPRHQEDTVFVMVRTWINRNKEQNSRKKLTCPDVPSASTGILQIASPESWWLCHSCRWQFAFHQGSTPLKWHCICEKSAHESTKTKRINLRKTLTYSSARSPGTRKRTGLYLLNLYDFQWYICPKKAPFRVASLTDTHNKNIFVLFIFLAH